MKNSNYILLAFFSFTLVLQACTESSTAGDPTTLSPPEPQVIVLDDFDQFTGFHGGWEVSGTFSDNGTSTLITGSSLISTTDINAGLEERLILNTQGGEEIEGVFKMVKKDGSFNGIVTFWYDTKDRIPYRALGEYFEHKEMVAVDGIFEDTGSTNENNSFTRVKLTYPDTDSFIKTIERRDDTNSEWKTIWNLTYSRAEDVTQQPAIALKCSDDKYNTFDFVRDPDNDASDEYYTLAFSEAAKRQNFGSRLETISSRVLGGCITRVVINGILGRTSNVSFRNPPLGSREVTIGYIHNEVYDFVINEQTGKWEMYSQAFFVKEYLSHLHPLTKHVGWFGTSGGGHTYFGIKKWIEFDEPYALLTDWDRFSSQTGLFNKEERTIGTDQLAFIDTIGWRDGTTRGDDLDGHKGIDPDDISLKFFNTGESIEEFGNISFIDFSHSLHFSDFGVNYAPIRKIYFDQ